MVLLICKYNEDDIPQEKQEQFPNVMKAPLSQSDVRINQAKLNFNYNICSSNIYKVV